MPKGKNSLIRRFKSVLMDASKLFGCPIYKVTEVQFRFVCKGRVRVQEYRLLGGYGAVRSYVAPEPETQIDKSVVKLLEKLLAHAEG